MAEVKKGKEVKKGGNFTKPGRSKNPNIISQAFKNEQVNKETKVVLACFRERAKNSTNPAFKSMHLGVPIFDPANTTLSDMNNQSFVNSNNSMNSMSLLDLSKTGNSKTFAYGSNSNLIPTTYVDSEGGKFLSRGAIPSMIPTDYTALPKISDWSAAQTRHKELQDELASLDMEISSRNTNLKNTISSSIRGESRDMFGNTNGLSARDINRTYANSNQLELDDNAPLDYRQARSSAVLGSTFKWQINGAKSHNNTSYDWPDEEIKPDLYPVSKTRYGMMSKYCDMPELKGQNDKIVQSRAKKRNN